MKKEYINPVMNVVRIETQQMLAVSDRGVVNESASITGDEYDD